MLNLSRYSRRDLNNFLQIAQQADNDSMPLPCLVVEQVIEAHDRMLRREEGTEKLPIPERNRTHFHAGVCKICAKETTHLHRLECGAKICGHCYNEV